MRNAIATTAMLLLSIGGSQVMYGQQRDVKSVVESLSRLPPPQMFKSYLEASKSSDFSSDADFLRNFAALAGKTLPSYSSTRSEAYENHLHQVLLHAAELNPQDRSTVFAAVEFCINHQEYAQSLKILERYSGDKSQHECAAWTAYAQSRLKSENAGVLAYPSFTFDIHFCVLTRNPHAQAKLTKDVWNEEINLLNTRFVDLKGNSVVKFKFKSSTEFGTIVDSSNPLLQIADNHAHNNQLAVKLFNECHDKQIRDPAAINFFVVDSYSTDRGRDDATSHGIRNSNYPFMLVDWQRLGGRSQNVEAHEMGHAFGLGHVSVVGATTRTPTNIMASTEHKLGSGGLRNLGFTESQVAIILYHARRTEKRLKTAGKDKRD